MSEAAPSIMAQSWLQGSQIEVKKVTVSLLKEKIIKKIGYLEVYVRNEAGTEAAIHSTNEMYNKKKKTNTILLFDAKMPLTC